MLCIGSGCGRTRWVPMHPETDSGDPGITADEAKTALIEMVESLKEDMPEEQLEIHPMWRSLSALRAAKPCVLDGGKVVLGGWWCDLARGSFSFSQAKPYVAVYEGVFRQDASGRWSAEITYSVYE
jgi:hypothetical protein